MKRNKSSANSGFFSNWQIKILCFIFAVLIFLLVYYTGMETRKVSVPLEVMLPEKYVPVSVVPDSAEVNIMGNESEIYMIKADSISLFADFSGVRSDGISIVPVEIDYKDLGSYVDLSKVFFRTTPLFVKVFFEEKQ